MEKPVTQQKIAIIGAGWAGLAAALSLAKAGSSVTLFERSPHAGGRAARAYEAGDKTPFALDNGQHVMIGAYVQVLALLTELGVDTQKELLHLPAQWLMPGRMTIQQPSWCAARPWLFAGNLKQLPMALGLLRDAWRHGGAAAALRVASSALRLRLQPPAPAETVDDWLRRTGWSKRHIQSLWQPLCAATLNTPSHCASATSFARVIQDGLMAGPQAAAMLIPRGDLSALMAQPALHQLSRLGATIHLHRAITRFDLVDGKPVIENEVFDQLVIATPPKDAWRLLSPHEPALAMHCSLPLMTLAQSAPEPISTIHLRADGVRLNQAVLILPDGDDAALNNSVLIDRSHLAADQAGWFTVVVSSSHAALALEPGGTNLAQRALQHLQRVLPQYAWPIESPSVVIHAKSATFSCASNAKRPNSRTGFPRVYLAGDYVKSDENYPATLEGAVRSGQRVAARIMAEAQAI